jgi:hypothetical protein
MEELPKRLGIGSRLPSMAPYFVWYMARGATGFFIPLYLYSIGSAPAGRPALLSGDLKAIEPKGT